MYDEVVRMDFVTDGAIDCGLIPSVGNATVESTRRGRVSIVAACDGTVRTSDITGDRPVHMERRVYIVSCWGHVCCV